MILYILRKFEYVPVFLASILLLSLLQLHPFFPDPDSFYHARIAADMVRGPIISFSALPDTALSDVFIDHHFLYHVLLIPFVTFFNPLIGIKISTVIFASLFLAFFYWLLRRATHQSRSCALFFLVLLALNSVFLFRINLAKIPAVSLIVFFAGIYAILKNRPAHLFGLSFLYVWLYAGWPLLPLSATIAWIVRAFSDFRISIDTKKFQLSTLNFKGSPTESCKLKVASCNIVARLFSQKNVALPLASLSGALAGLIINPYFPTNVFFYWIQTFKIAIVNILTDVPVGSEWYSAGVSFIPLHGPTLMLLVFSLCAFLFPGLFVAVFRTPPLRRTYAQWFMFVMTVLFFALTLKSRRYGEYFAPLATLFSSLVLAPLFSKELFLHLWGYIKESLRSPRTARGMIVLYFFFAAPVIIGASISSVTADFQSGYRFSQYANGMRWLADTIPAGGRIVHNRWDDFPLFYYHAPEYGYVSGLDPRFLYEKNPERAKKYTAFSQGNDLAETFGYRGLCTAASSSLDSKHDARSLFFACTPRAERAETEKLVATFNPSAVVITHLNEGLQEKILGIPEFSEAYRDDEMIIFIPREP
ncbi:hypothetical protein HY623_03310 [Candidatus Uhrbacteria bacterium]|nr:hypothetical protein [Candidatus Uhrbacteria bacterium]